MILKYCHEIKKKHNTKLATVSTTFVLIAEVSKKAFF